MKTSDEMRRENLDRLTRERGGVKKFSEFLEMSSSQLSQWLNASKDSKTDRRRGISGDSARAIEEKTGLPRGWMDNDHNSADVVEKLEKCETENNRRAGDKNRLYLVDNRLEEIAPDEFHLLQGYRDASDECKEFLINAAKHATEKKKLFQSRSEKK